MIFVYIILAIAILLFMVLIHEFGHYCIGRMLNFKITEFSVGFGKAIFSRKNKRGELISLRIFPLGGYCAFAGEDETNPKDKDAFTNQAPWKRILVFLAGVTFNFATAVIFSLILLCTIGYDIPQVTTNFNSSSQVLYDVLGNKINGEVVGVNTYLNSLPDDAQVLQPGDIIISINGEKIDFAYGSLYGDLRSIEYSNMLDYMEEEEEKAKDAGVEFDAVETFNNYIINNSSNITTAVVKRDRNYVDNVYLGFYLVQTRVASENESGETVYEIVNNYCLDSNVQAYVHTFWEALERAVPFAIGLVWVVLKSLWLLITFQLPLSMIGGPLTTIETIAVTTQTNLANLLILLPAISANLAIFNVLPIPALDGAHVLFTTIEAIRKKPIKRETENMIHLIGLFVLFGIVVLVDILHFLL